MCVSENNFAFSLLNCFSSHFCSVSFIFLNLLALQIVSEFLSNFFFFQFQYSITLLRFIPTNVELARGPTNLQLVWFQNITATVLKKLINQLVVLNVRN